MRVPIIKKDFFAVLICLISILTFYRYTIAETISLNEYESRIREAVDHCESFENSSSLDLHSKLLRLFPPELFVQKGNKEIFPIDSKGILSLLKETDAGEDDLKNLRTHLSVLLQHVGFAKEDRVSSLDWTESHRHLEEIYLTKEFKGLRERKTPFWVTFMEKISNIFRDWFYKNMGKIVNISSGIGNTLLYVMYGMIILLGGVIIFWISKSFGWFGWQSKDKTVSLENTESLKTLDWGSWRKDAVEKAAKGEFREAIRCLFVSVLMEGHIKGWWIYKPEATNSEHLERMEGSVSRIKDLRSMVGIYERAWYGLGHPGEGEFQKCKKIAQHIEAAS